MIEMRYACFLTLYCSLLLTPIKMAENFFPENEVHFSKQFSLLDLEACIGAVRAWKGWRGEQKAPRAGSSTCPVGK